LRSGSSSLEPKPEESDKTVHRQHPKASANLSLHAMDDTQRGEDDEKHSRPAGRESEQVQQADAAAAAAGGLSGKDASMNPVKKLSREDASMNPVKKLSREDAAVAKGAAKPPSKSGFKGWTQSIYPTYDTASGWKASLSEGSRSGPISVPAQGVG
jgi:hypothetical protein